MPIGSPSSRTQAMWCRSWLDESPHLGVLKGACVAGEAVDSHAEKVARSSEVAVGGEDFVEDPVFSQPSWRQVQNAVKPHGAYRLGVPGCLQVDQQVRVDCAGPALLPVVEVYGQPLPDGVSQGNGPVAEAESAVLDVGQLQLSDLAWHESVERQKGGDECRGGMSAVDALAYGGRCQRERITSFRLLGSDAGGRVTEDRSTCLEDSKDRPESLALVGPGGPALRQSVQHVLSGDLTQAGVACRGPVPDRGQRMQKKKPDGLLISSRLVGVGVAA